MCIRDSCELSKLCFFAFERFASHVDLGSELVELSQFGFGSAFGAFKVGLLSSKGFKLVVENLAVSVVLLGSLVENVAFFIELATSIDQLVLLTSNELALLVELTALFSERLTLLIEVGLFCIEVFALVGDHCPLIIELDTCSNELGTFEFDLGTLA